MLLKTIPMCLIFIGGCILCVNGKPLFRTLETVNNKYGFAEDIVRSENSLKEETNGPFVRFLVAVNATEVPCVATVLTAPLQAGRKYNQSEAVTVGACDKGPLQFDMQVTQNMTINLTFHSSVIEDASPPTCQITWDGEYLRPPPPTQITAISRPSQPPSQNLTSPTMFPQTLPSLLPGCFTMDSREGWHMTYYWFYVLDWRL